MWYESSWFVGILSGLISSFCFFLILFLVKPRIKVSEKICVSKDKNGDYFYKVKIVNKTRSMLVDVDYSLFYKTIKSDGVDSLVEIHPLKPKLKYISKYNRSKNKNDDYAVRITYKIDKDKYPFNDNTRLLFSIVASHKTTGTTKALSAEYTKEMIREGVFETGTSTRILNIK